MTIIVLTTCVLAADSVADSADSLVFDGAGNSYEMNFVCEI